MTTSSPNARNGKVSESQSSFCLFETDEHETSPISSKNGASKEIDWAFRVAFHCSYLFENDTEAFRAFSVYRVRSRKESQLVFFARVVQMNI